MKILHVVPSYLPAWRYGGPIRSVHGLARAQAAAGDAVEVFTTDADGPGRLAVPNDRAVDRDGVAVHYFRLGWPARQFRAPELGRALARRVREFDIVHLHSVFLWPTWRAARAARRAGVPYLLSPRGILDPELLRRRGRWRKRLWIAIVERRTLGGAAAIHVTSEVEATGLRALRLDLAPIVVVPNGVDLALAAERDGGTPATLVEAAMARGPYWLALGRLAAKKRLDLLVAATAQLPGLRLLVAGNDDEGLGPRLASQAARLGVTARCELLGEVRGEALEHDVAEVLRRRGRTRRGSRLRRRAGCRRPRRSGARPACRPGGGYRDGHARARLRRGAARLGENRRVHAPDLPAGDRRSQPMSDRDTAALDLAAVVLCHNEEPNIRRCLDSVAGWCPLFVVDSGSTDRTREICAEYTPHVVEHPYANHAAQWQWALDHLPLDREWILALDADFVVSPELRAEIERRLPALPREVAGVYVRHRYVFGGGPIRFGGTKHEWLRLIRRGRARPDLSDLVDFRFVVDGRVERFRGHVVEENRHDEDLSVWLRKQDKFALRLAVEEELRRAGLNRWQGRPRLLGTPDERFMRLRDFWLRLPLFLRPALYFFYRFVLRLGFLDGRAGFLYAALQGFWLRLAVDWKIDELRRHNLGPDVLLALRDQMMTTRDGSVPALVAAALGPRA